MKTLIIALGLTLSPIINAASIDDIDMAMNQMDLKALGELTQQSQGYTKAYGAYRQAVAAGVMGQKALQISAAAEAASILESSEFAADAEAKALLAAVYGVQIGANPELGASLGAKIATLMQQAATLAPNNPRVALIAGINAFYTPVAFGGGEQKALEAIAFAIDGFKAPCSDICWGEAEAYTWRGLVHQQQGDLIAATADWQQALTVDANYGWANYLLESVGNAPQ